MRYEVNANTFMQLPYTTGTIQNVSNTDIEISNEQTIGTGIVLKAGETFAFNNATVYACARPVLNGGTGIISVVPFNGEGEGGESPIYVPKGSIAFASLPTTLNSTMLGWTYNISDAFTTDNRFVEGSGIDYPAGENVVVVEASTGVFKYDCFGGAYILPVANTTTLGGVKSSDDEGKVMVNNDGTMTYNPLGYRQPSTAYAVGQIAYHSALSMQKLVCVQTGTTASGDITPSTTEGALVTDGTVVWQVDSLADGNYTATHQNDIGGGRDITAYWESGIMSNNIQAGIFVGMHIGDYIIKSVTIGGTTYSNVKWVVMDLDYFLHTGDTEATAHHVVIMPESNLGSAQMNDTNTTAGGYLGSKMWTEHIPKVVAGFEAAFGASHILEHGELLSNAMDANLKPSSYNGWSGAASGWAWASVKVNLANENMVYGTPVVSSSFFDTGECNSQLAAFHLNHDLLCSKRYWWWLRSVALTSAFCGVDGTGSATYTGAASSRSVRPVALLH